MILPLSALPGNSLALGKFRPKRSERWIFFLLSLATSALWASDQAKDKAAFEKALAAPWQEVFFDPCTGAYGKQWSLDGEIGAVETTPTGMRVSGGPRFGNDAHHVVLWTKESFQGDVKIEYEYTRLDFENRGVSLLYVHATGSGKGPFVRDISQWNELRKIPAMKLYYNHMNLYHLSYAAFPVDGKDTTAYIRGRRYLPETGKGIEGTDLKPDYFPVGLFEPGVPHQITVIKKGHNLLMRIKNDQQTYFCKMGNDALPEATEGRLGLRHMATRSARYKDFRISNLK
jgi:hypothetical protein